MEPNLFSVTRVEENKTALSNWADLPTGKGLLWEQFFLFKVDPFYAATLFWILILSASP